MPRIPQWRPGERIRATRDPLARHMRDQWFRDHCRLFHNRPFIWHVWDGEPDGFSALVNYHRLAGPDGEGRRTLAKLTYHYLGDWIEQCRGGVSDDVDGAGRRLAAAEGLQRRLEAIALGEPPLDIFVRWRPLHRQPVGWEPDLDDGVRLNIRPFVRAGVLRRPPRIGWAMDKGVEPSHAPTGEHIRPREAFPWFWGCPGTGTERQRTDFLGGAEFDGVRWNDLHYTRAAKEAARANPPDLPVVRLRPMDTGQQELFGA